MIQVELIIDENLPGVIDGKQLRSEVQRAIGQASRGAGSETANSCLAVRLVGEEVSRMLNAHYRGKDHSTNVLAFAPNLQEVILPEDLAGGILGDLAICWPVTLAEARHRQIPVLHHFLHLLVHGFLHLRGYDHQEETGQERMEALEIQILAELGVANPYWITDV